MTCSRTTPLGRSLSQCLPQTSQTTAVTHSHVICHYGHLQQLNLASSSTDMLISDFGTAPCHPCPTTGAPPAPQAHFSITGFPEATGLSRAVAVMAEAQIATARRQVPRGCSSSNVEAPARAAHLWCSLCPRPAPHPLHIQMPDKLHIQTSSCLGNSIFRDGCLICVFCPPPFSILDFEPLCDLCWSEDCIRHGRQR